MTRWELASGTTVGDSHVARGRGSDDAIATAQSGKWTAIVVCDGAGSAKRSREGADFVSSEFSQHLLKIASKIDSYGPGPWLNDTLIHSLLKIRSKLAQVSGSYDLRDFHCTLVGALVSDSGGFSVHIGDGAIFMGIRRSNGDVRIVVHSEPENGEYANETFFITETTWLKNIRIKPLGTCDWVAATTDGASSLLLDRGIKQDVFSELFKAISFDADNIDDVLDDLINSTYARSLSNDDKSVALAFRGRDVFFDYSNISNDQLVPSAEIFSRDHLEVGSVLSNPAHYDAGFGWHSKIWNKVSCIPLRSLFGVLILVFFVTSLLIYFGYFAGWESDAQELMSEFQCSPPIRNIPNSCGI